MKEDFLKFIIEEIKYFLNIDNNNNKLIILKLQIC